MSLPEQLNISTDEIRRVESLPGLKKFLSKLTKEIQYIYHKIKTSPANSIRTNTWKIYEDSNGDIVFDKWDGSAWQTAHKIKGS
jgi:hypothetical protein